MTRRAKFLGLGLVLLATACGDDGVGSDAQNASELPKPIPGTALDTPKSNAVDPNAWYLGRRNIQLLVDLGALTADELSAARRADGILDNNAPNGELGARELADLEKDENWNMLFPAEQQAVQKLWSLLLLDDVNVAASPCDLGADPVPILDDDPHQRPSYAVTIASLPSALQPTAKRIQLAYDSDADDTTITGRDVADAHANAGAFLPSEVEQMQPILDEIEAAMAAPDPTIPRYVITDSACNEALTTGPITTTVFSTPTLEGQWIISHNKPPSGVQVAFDHGARFTPPQPGDRVVAYDLDVGTEYPQDPTGAPLEVPSPSQESFRGTVGLRVELWRAGARIEVHEVEFAPNLPTTHRLHQFLPVEIEATGEILYPNWDNATKNGNLNRISNVTLAPQPSSPSVWHALTADQDPSLLTFGTFVQYGKATDAAHNPPTMLAAEDPDLYEVTFYEGGWATVYRGGELKRTMVPQFFLSGSDFDTYCNGTGGCGVRMYTDARPPMPSYHYIQPRRLWQSDTYVTPIVALLTPSW